MTMISLSYLVSHSCDVAPCLATPPWDHQPLDPLETVDQSQMIQEEQVSTADRCNRSTVRGSVRDT